jgi:hypothetical protein
MTKALINKLAKLPKLYANDGKPAGEVPVAVKFFNPYGAGSWYITEGEAVEGGDMMLFGLCVIHGPELGYVLLSELVNFRARGIGCLYLEVDKYFSGSLAKAMRAEGMEMAA